MWHSSRLVLTVIASTSVAVHVHVVARGLWVHGAIHVHVVHQVQRRHATVAIVRSGSVGSHGWRTDGSLGRDGGRVQRRTKGGSISLQDRRCLVGHARRIARDRSDFSRAKVATVTIVHDVGRDASDASVMIVKVLLSVFVGGSVQTRHVVGVLDGGDVVGGV